MQSINKIYICKPGTLLVARPDKTNLQLREMQALRTVLKKSLPTTIETELITVPELCQLELDKLENAAIICFNSAKCFDNELMQLLRTCSVLDSIDLTLISNDCRLNFNLGEHAVASKIVQAIQQHRCNLRILTNATEQLDKYITKIIDWPDAKSLPIYSANLYTLPTFMSGAHKVDKTVGSVFACMHFCDYSDERKLLLTAIKEQLGDDMVLTGDMQGMTCNGEQVASIITDTKDVWQWYCNAKTTPVLLEPNYDLHGVMPNRVSEALACDCLPVLFSKSITPYSDSRLGMLPIIHIDSIDAIAYYQYYIDNYDKALVQQKLESAKQAMQLDIELFQRQLYNIFVR